MLLYGPGFRNFRSVYLYLRQDCGGGRGPDDCQRVADHRSGWSATWKANRFDPASDLMPISAFFTHRMLCFQPWDPAYRVFLTDSSKDKDFVGEIDRRLTPDGVSLVL